MSRAAPATDVIEVKPANNVYTALAALGFVAVSVAFYFLFARAGLIFVEGKGLFN